MPTKTMSSNEPRHDKTIRPVWSESSLSAWRNLGSLATRWAHSEDSDQTVRPAKTQISLGIRPVWSESSLSAWRNLGSSANNWARSKDWSVWADAKADLSLRSAHSIFVGFVMSRLKSDRHKSEKRFPVSWYQNRLCKNNRAVRKPETHI